MSITEKDVKRIAMEAVALYAANHPVPASVTATEAADMLGVSVRTVARMKLPKVGGKIPYSAVVEALASR